MEILILSLFVNFPINRSSCYNTIIWIKQASILSERDSFILEFYNRTEDGLFRVYDVYSYSVHRIRGGTKGSVWYRRAHPPLQPRLFRGNGCFNDFHLSVRLASWMHRPVCDSTIELGNGGERRGLRKHRVRLVSRFFDRAFNTVQHPVQGRSWFAKLLPLSFRILAKVSKMIERLWRSYGLKN